MPEEDRTLLQSQKNKVAELVAAAGLAPNAFQWLSLRTDFRWVSKLEHKASKFFYTFDYVTNQYEGEQPMASYSPGPSLTLTAGTDSGGAAIREGKVGDENIRRHLVPRVRIVLVVSQPKWRQ